MAHDAQSTVAFLQTPPGKGGIAMIGLTGPRAEAMLSEMFRPRPGHEASSADDATLLLGRLTDDRDVIDEAVVASTPQGFEINIHGGPIAARRVLRRLTALGAIVTSDGHDVPLEPAHPQWHNPAIGRELQVVLPGAGGAFVVSALTNQWSAGLSRLAREAC